MAIAVFKLVKCTGTNAAAETDCSKHPTFLSADTHTEQPSTYPIIIPQISGSISYSYETWLKYECTTAPDNYIQNVKFFGPGSQPDSPENKLTVFAATAASGSTPTDSESSIATTSQHDNYYSVGTALTIPISAAGQGGKIDAVGEQTDFLIMQLKVAYGAQAGSMETQTYNMQYEET